MPIISTLERKSIKGRIGLFFIYFFLLIGSVSMIYPFLLMIRRTTIDDIDKDSLFPLPQFLWNKDQTTRKYLLYQYHIDPKNLPWIYDAFIVEKSDGLQFLKWEYLSQANTKSVDRAFHTRFWEEYLSEFEKIPKKNLYTRVVDYESFVKNCNLWYIQPLLTYRPGRGFNNQWIQFYLAKKENVSPKKYQYFEAVRPQWTRRDWFPEFNQNLSKWEDWISNHLQDQEKGLYSANVIWGQYLYKKYKGNVVQLRKSHGINYKSFATGPVFSVEKPKKDEIAEDWNDFIINYYPLLWQEIHPDFLSQHQEEWREWLASKKNITDIKQWNLFTGQNLPDESQIVLEIKMPRNDSAAKWWSEFVHKYVPPSHRIIHSPEKDFINFLKTKYKTIDSLNEAWAANFADFSYVKIPRRECDYYTISEYSSGIKWELLTVNYKRVFKILAMEGNAISNTLIIVILCLLTGLTVNPLAAYALSRFNLKSAHKILIFLLATMALPAEVAMVPSFLLIKDLGLINTYFALVLPHAANAFSIFLLKGFFDSLPAELYEAATLDGADEFYIFTKITIPLSMPILSVIILHTTMAGYNMFMPVVIYISNQDKWPISTKIYEINQISGGALGMTALALASIFPLIVFIFCQRMIMRGIILPSFK